MIRINRTFQNFEALNNKAYMHTYIYIYIGRNKKRLCLDVRQLYNKSMI